MKLSPRLKTVADAVGTCNILADVGTDHGYIPVYMLENGFCKRAYASDIREQPLARASATIKANGFETVASTYLSDGILGIPEDYDALVIAGMGGETIISILEAKRPPSDARLILQPMTEEAMLREYLYLHGYSITAETAVAEPDHVYTVITAVLKPMGEYTLRDVLASPAFCERKSADAERYIMKFIRKNERMLNGLRLAREPRHDEIMKTEKELEELYKILQLVRI